MKRNNDFRRIESAFLRRMRAANADQIESPVSVPFSRPAGPPPWTAYQVWRTHIKEPRDRRRDG
jgi:hypothetical protein